MTIDEASCEALRYLVTYVKDQCSCHDAEGLVMNVFQGSTVGFSLAYGRRSIDYCVFVGASAATF